MLKRLILTTAMSLAALSSAWAEDKVPVTGKTCSELLAFYKSLPFTSILPLPDGPVSIPGKTGDITVGFSQTGFNHPWRTAMLAALQAEACRHPNIQIVVVDGNVDDAKQNNDVRDLLARGVDAVLMSLLAATAQNLRKLAKLIPLPALIFAT